MKAITHKRKLFIATIILFAGCVAVISTIASDPALASFPDHQVVPVVVYDDRDAVPGRSQIRVFVANPVRLAKIEFVPNEWLRLWLKEWETSPAWTEEDVYCYIGNLPTQAAGSFDVSMIDPRSILLNHKVPISGRSNQILPNYPGFAGRVLQVGFNKREALLSLGIEGEESSAGYRLYRVSVKGQMPEMGRWFQGSALIKVKGEKPSRIPEVTPKTEVQAPNAFALCQNFPNPFNPETQISYSLPKEAHVTLTIYSVLGQKVKTLVDELQDAGYKSVHWDGENDSGNKVSSGIYFYRIQAGDYSQTRRMVLLE
jgi:hypothetical protein